MFCVVVKTVRVRVHVTFYCVGVVILECITVIRHNEFVADVRSHCQKTATPVFGLIFLWSPGWVHTERQFSVFSLSLLPLSFFSLFGFDCACELEFLFFFFTNQITSSPPSPVLQ